MGAGSREGAVFNIGKLLRGKQRYYLDQVARSQEEYYTGAGEAPGHWAGAAAVELEVASEVSEDGLLRMLAGAHPDTAARLGGPPHGERVLAFDLTFRAPKSVSLLYALGGPVVSRAASDSHAKTAGYLYQAVLRHQLTHQLGVAWGRVHNGVADIVGIPQPVLVAFSRRRQQITRRLAERGEHSAKSAQTAALDTRRGKERRVSEQTLRGRWRRRAEAVGFAARELEAVVDQAASQPAAPIDQDRLLAHLAGPEGLTREASTFCRRDLLRAICEQLPAGAELGEIERLADQFLRAEGLVIPLTYIDDDLAPAGDTIRRADGRAVSARADTQRYSTHELVALEASVIAAAQRRQDEGAGVVPEQLLDEVLASHVGRRVPRAAGDASPARLADDQVAMVRALATSGHGVQVVNARAGTGKTFALDAARAAWQAAGHRVLGAALAGKAASELTDGSGIESGTVSRLLLDLEDPRAPGLGANTVLVVDEAAMVGTRQLGRLLQHAEQVGAKVALVGDSAQLPEIDCGGLFRGLSVRLGAIQLTENRRQVHQWEREALELLRAGNAGNAIDRYWQHDRVVVRGSAPAVRSQLVADW